MLFEEDTMNFKDFQNVSNLDPGIERIIKESFKIKTVMFNIKNDVTLNYFCR